MFVTRSIISDCDKYELSILEDYDNSVMLELRFPNKEVQVWDNAEWLFNRMYLKLKKNKKEYVSLQPIPREDYPELLLMFEKAFELGFFDKTKIILE